MRKEVERNTYLELMKGKHTHFSVEESGLSRSPLLLFSSSYQIHVCNKDFADFVVWKKKDIHIERILPDKVFGSKYQRRHQIFHHVAMPELVSRYYTRKTIKKDGQSVHIQTHLHMIMLVTQRFGVRACQNKDGRMIACDSSDCSIHVLALASHPGSPLCAKVISYKCISHTWGRAWG